MAYLPIAEVLDKKYITDTAIACALKRGELTLEMKKNVFFVILL